MIRISRKIIFAFAIIFILIFSSLPYAFASGGINIDTASVWARNGIAEATEKGFVSVDLDKCYTDAITRAEFCNMAVKWLEYRLESDIYAILREKGISRIKRAFTDTDDAAILAAYALGITKGTGDGRFSPDGQIVREQAAVMIRNACAVAGMNVGDTSGAGYVDIKSASDWAVDAINFCRNNNIMFGTGNNNFSPNDTFSIEQSVLAFNNISFVCDADLIRFANELFDLTNAERSKAGLELFEQTPNLTKTARQRAGELTEKFSGSHERPDGSDCFTAYIENGVVFNYAGENIASGQRTPGEAINGWMNSPGHKANILNENFRHLGVGVALDAAGQLYWSQNFTD